MAKHNQSENTKNYILLSILRNQKLEGINIGWCNSNNKDWQKINQERLSIEKGISTGLENLGVDSRATLYTEACQMREKVESTYYAAELATDIPVEEKASMLQTCKTVKEAVDYLETMLQLQFPSEFPNEFVHNILFGDKGYAKEGESIIEEMKLDEPSAFEPVQSFIEENSTPLTYEHPDLIDGMDPGLAMFLYDTKKELTNNFTTLPEGFNNPEGLLVNGMDPGLASLLIQARNDRIARETEIISVTEGIFEQQ